jgi:hypothetical protein
METTEGGNGVAKAIIVGVSILVLGAVVVGAGAGSINNTIVNNTQQVEVDSLKQDMLEQKASVAKIPVMDERIKDIKDDVGKILQALKDRSK